MPFVSVQTASGKQVLQKWHHHDSNNDGNKDQKQMKPRWSYRGEEEFWRSSNSERPCKAVPFQEEMCRLQTGFDNLTSLIVNSDNICR